ncbi:MAG: type restriction enzyme protein [Methylobacteriaceae bacterium]|nr:type restriction enzyme protein [Methylobacteriaceae bacterium]
MKDFGFKPADIRLKASLKELKVGKGAKSALYKPDYVIFLDGVPVLVLDAKSPSEEISGFEYQCASYCLELNKAYEFNPVQHFVLSNGLKTSLHKWDKATPLLELTFSEVEDANPTFKQLRSSLSKHALGVALKSSKATIDKAPFPFGTVGLAELRAKFQKVHQYIWTKEKKSPSAAFQELMKIIFVKLKKDKELHDRLGPGVAPQYEDVVFSTHWISSYTENESPVNDPLFKKLVKELDAEISDVKKKKKRIFDADEEINLSRDTIRWIVRELQHIDLLSMEEDIHGRMFETFLDATIRGRELGQFFTPRDIVNLMVRLVDIKVAPNKVSTILDACCGSGGFLIAAMGEMIRSARNLAGLTNHDRAKLMDVIQNASLYGVDAGSDPPIHRIARMNMYLHGDGGSHIFHADSLDKNVGEVGKQSLENERQLKELREIIVQRKMKFDVILSNPPFSLKYGRDDEEHVSVLNQYEIGVTAGGREAGGLLSSVMFLERYKDLVAPDGEIIAIIDESVLSGDSYKDIRNYIREKFIILGIISLPGDAFRRASARVKTSILILRLRKEEEVQTDVFMTSAIFLGLEEKVARRIGAYPASLDAEKKSETDRIVKEYKNYRSGIKAAYCVSSDRLLDRLDVKHCLADSGRKVPIWTKKGLSTVSLGSVIQLASGRQVSVLPMEGYQFLRVSYDGDVIEGDYIDGEECSYSKLFVVKEWDIVLSNMGVGRGAVGIVPPFHAGKHVSNEYTIVRANSKEEAVYYINLLRTKEILGDILATTTGMNRGRIRWDNIASVKVPKYREGNTDIEQVVIDLEKFWAARSTFEKSRAAHVKHLVSDLDVDGDDARRRWLAFKPPE